MHSDSPGPIRASRRRFVGGLAAGGVLAGLAPPVRPVWALAGPGQPTVLAGSEFDLVVDSLPVDFTGRTVRAVAVNGSIPAPVLRWREGDSVTIRVANRLAEDTSIHWHGILLPADMDGVPGLSFTGIHPGQTFTYRFDVRQSGTYWYHSHSNFQEQIGHYGPLIVDPIAPEPFAYDRDYVVMLSDWTDEDPRRIYAKLKKQAHYYNRNERTVGDFLRDVRTMGWRETLADRRDWGRMRMSPTDLADVSGATYTYLINGTTPNGNWTGLFRHGERIRLRVINGSAMTFFDLRIPGLKMTVVAADGQYVRPVTVDEFRIGVAETYDVIVEPDGSAEAFTIFAQAMDRSGYARATLATRPGLAAPVPEPDRVVLLTMADMGHDHHGDHGTQADAHAHHAAPPHAGHGAHGGHGAMQAHPASESGNYAVDMQTMTPRPRLDDPGIGLRDNGRRVLTYADLRSSFPDPDGREPGREIELHLTGHMERYIWSFDGVKFSDAHPLVFRYGERLRLTLVNDTMMEHPIHLHGMWSDLEDEHGAFLVRKHTVNMPPGTRRSLRITADALGRWAFHCHLLYHMEAGMFREVRVIE
ncbi:copper resistance system multicopper oxidase [Coralloluteibacterium thermophilus]|uniref:Copper resistance system multicopper oxidase n=1 Tax=Coralloluteibacterium thermophilum TaxID=2707049 RepID=A0ABV9NLM1_9GAMM